MRPPTCCRNSAGTSAEVLANMEAKEASEVRELLGFEENTAGGLMTTSSLFFSRPRPLKVPPSR